MRITATRLCTRHLSDDGTSIRVWCSHLGGHPNTASQSEHATDERLRRAPGKRKNRKKPLLGGVCLLTTGVLIRVRLAPFGSTTSCVLFILVMPRDGDERAFFAAAPFEFVSLLGGSWSFGFAGFAVHVQTRGPWLPSGRRSRVRQVIEVSVSWPHDNWRSPRDAEPGCSRRESFL